MTATELISVISALTALLVVAVQYLKNRSEGKKSDAEAVDEIAEAASRIVGTAEQTMSNVSKGYQQRLIDYGTRVERLENTICEMAVAIEEANKKFQEAKKEQDVLSKAHGKQISLLRSELERTIEELAGAKLEISQLQVEKQDLEKRLSAYEEGSDGVK